MSKKSRFNNHIEIGVVVGQQAGRIQAKMEDADARESRGISKQFRYEVPCQGPPDFMLPYIRPDNVYTRARPGGCLYPWFIHNRCCYRLQNDAIMRVYDNNDLQAAEFLATALSRVHLYHPMLGVSLGRGRVSLDHVRSAEMWTLLYEAGVLTISPVFLHDQATLIRPHDIVFAGTGSAEQLCQAVPQLMRMFPELATVEEALRCIIVLQTRVNEFDRGFNAGHILMFARAMQPFLQGILTHHDLWSVFPVRTNAPAWNFIKSLSITPVPDYMH